MGGIIPNKEDAITPGLLWLASLPGGTTYNLSDPTTFGGLTERLGWRSQFNVVEFLKAEVKQFPEWVDAANAVFEGFRRGVPGGEDIPLPLAIVETLASQITGLPPGTWANVNEVVTDLNSLPGVAQVIALLTNLPTVALTDAGTVLGAYGSNLNAFLGATDFTSPTFSVVDAATTFVNLILAPLNLIPTLVGGLIPALNIPPLDASKITSGAFAAPLLQSLIDAISQGFGGATGLGFSALHTLLSGLPTAQALSDAIGAGLGHLAGGYTPANITTFLGAIPGGNIASTLLASVIPGLDVSKIVSGVFSTGFIPNLPAGQITSGVFGSGLIPGLDLSKITSGLGTGIATWLGVGGALPGATTLNATGLTGLATGMSTWLTAAGSIPAAATLQGSQLLGSVASSLLSGTLSTALIPGFDVSKITTGVFGQGFIPSLTSTWGGTIANTNVIGKVSADIGTDISQLITAVTTGAGNATIPGTLANLTAQINGISSLLGYRPSAEPPAASTSGIALTQAAFTAMRSATRPTFLALADSTGDVTFPFPLVGTSATTIPVTQAVPAIGSIGTTDGGVAGTDPTTWPLKKSISFCGSKSGTILAMYLTINRVNVTTGATTWVHTSPNIVASVPSAMNRVYYNMANAVDYVPVGQNEYYQIELRILGSGTYNLVGIANSWAPANAVGFPTHIGATRTPPNLYSASSQTTGDVKNPSWTLTTVAGDNCILVDLTAYSNASAITALAVTCGGIAMAQKSFTADWEPDAAQWAYTAQFELHNTAFAAFTAGAKTIAVTTTGGGTSGTQCAVYGNATSYQNISAVSSGTTATGTTANPSQTVTGLTANSATITHSALGSDIAAFSAASQNLIANISGALASMIVQDQLPYATSVPFTGTNGATGGWGGSVVTLTSTLATLVAPASVAAPGFTPSSNLPWFMFGGAAGVSGAAVATHQPSLQTFTSSDVYHRKSWAKFYDIIACSGAGGGANGDNLVGGYPGAAGIWNSVTLTAADVAGDSSWDVTVGNGGLGGSGGTGLAASGFAGGDSYVDIGGYGIAAYTPGGVGGTSNNGTVAGSPGGGPGDITVSDEPYYGGSGGASAQASGTQPGGSGAGGNAVFSGSSFYGGSGAPGIVYILARQ